MATVLFIDPVPHPPYSPPDLATRALGGAEGAVLRVAEGLAEDHSVYVAQKRREAAPEESTRARYVGYAELDAIERPDKVVVVRSPFALGAIRRRFPTSDLYLWAHDQAVRWGWVFWPRLVRLDVTLVLVSDFHRAQALRNVRPTWLSRLRYGRRELKTARVYEPVDDDLEPDGTPWDPDKLVFASSPHKGLLHTIELFQQVRRAIPGLTLYVANPGYIRLGKDIHYGREGEHAFLKWVVRFLHPEVKRTDLLDVENVVDLGLLPQRELWQHVRGALCVFSPNPVFPETFGLVFAESNAVGTPVLTYPLGAAPEVLGDARQLVDRDGHVEHIVERLERWRAGERPAVRMNPAFRLSAVLAEWRALLGLSR